MRDINRHKRNILKMVVGKVCILQKRYPTYSIIAKSLHDAETIGIIKIDDVSHITITKAGKRILKRTVFSK